MDGNGRWAVQRGLERVRGHQQGARSVRDVVTECARLRKDRGGPDYLTLYSFSIENWKRPVNEVTFLMQMYIEYLRSERQTMMDNNIRFRQSDRLDHLPERGTAATRSSLQNRDGSRVGRLKTSKSSTR